MSVIRAQHTPFVLGDSATTITFNDWDLAGSTVGDVFSADLSIATFRLTDDVHYTRNQATQKPMPQML